MAHSPESGAPKTSLPTRDHCFSEVRSLTRSIVTPSGRGKITRQTCERDPHRRFVFGVREAMAQEMRVEISWPRRRRPMSQQKCRAQCSRPLHHPLDAIIKRLSARDRRAEREFHPAPEAQRTRADPVHRLPRRHRRERMPRILPPGSPHRLVRLVRLVPRARDSGETSSTMSLTSAFLPARWHY